MHNQIKVFFVVIISSLSFFLFSESSNSNNIDINLDIINSFQGRISFDANDINLSGNIYYTDKNPLEMSIGTNTGSTYYKIFLGLSGTILTGGGSGYYTNIENLMFLITGNINIYIQFFRDRPNGTGIYTEASKITNVKIYYNTGSNGGNNDNNTGGNNTGDEIVKYNGGGTRYNLGDLVDRCTNGDNSPSYYDGRCGDEVHNSSDLNNKDNTITQNNTNGNNLNLTRNDEIKQAYDYAYKLGMVSSPGFQSTEVYGPIKRKELAIVISIFVSKIMGKLPNYDKECIYNDIDKLPQETQNYIELSCKLDLMGIDYKNDPNKGFDPERYVDRAIFGTILSRILYGSKFNIAGQYRYKNHLGALKRNNIMKQNTPFMKELKGFVMIMLKRVDDKYFLTKE